jgi:hypothetical protein
MCERLILADMTEHGICHECLAVLSRGKPDDYLRTRRVRILEDPTGDFSRRAMIPVEQFEIGLGMMTWPAGMLIRDEGGDLKRVWESAGTKQWTEPE